MPLISVIVPAYNATSTISETLESLALQTFRDFELVLVDDASDDGDALRDLLDRYSKRLPCRVLRNSQNAGVARSLNYGLSQSDSQYVARLDADDLARPDRLAKQLEFMVIHPLLDVCGSQMLMFRTQQEGSLGTLVQPMEDRTIRTALVQRNAISHPSVLLKRSFFSDVGLYQPSLDYAEDYDLWCRGALLGKRFVNHPEALTSYRIHANQIGQTKAQLQYDRDIEVKCKYMAALLGDLPLAYLPQLFAGGSHFVNRDVAGIAVTESLAALIALGSRVADPVEYAAIVKAALARHLQIGTAK